MEISTDTSKVMTFVGKEPNRSKIRIDKTLIERVNSFNYLGYNVSYTDDKDMAIKVSTFVEVTGVINQVFKPSQMQRHTRLRVYKTDQYLPIAARHGPSGRQTKED
jgi:hypothetical protein